MHVVLYLHEKNLCTAPDTILRHKNENGEEENK